MTPVLAHDLVTAPEAAPDRWMYVLHGVYGAGRNWSSVARRFARERPGWGAVLVDLRLHGDSSGFEPPHTLARCAADVAALERRLELPADAVLGHSFGGKVALLHAQAAAAPPSSVWVVDSTPASRAPDGSAWQMLEVLRRHPGPFTDRAEGIAAVESGGFTRPVAQWMSTNLVDDPHGDGLAWRIQVDDMEALLRDFFATDAWPTVERPPDGSEIHVVKARESNVLDDEACERILSAGRATGGRVHLHHVDGGHWVNADDPEGLQRLLLRHLDGS